MRSDPVNADGEPGGGRPRPPVRSGLQPTRPVTLVVAALVSAALAWFGFSRFYGHIPYLTWLAGLTLAGLAVAEAIAAHDTRARVEHRPRSGALEPLVVARLAVLAKASSLAGAIFGGAYGGVASWSLMERDNLTVAARNLAPSIAGVVGALALVAAALLLERACRVPEPPDDNGTAGGAATPRR